MHQWRNIQQFDGDPNDFETKWWLRIKVSRSAPYKIVLARRALNSSGWIDIQTREEVWPDQFSKKEREQAYDLDQDKPFER